MLPKIGRLVKSYFVNRRDKHFRFEELKIRTEEGWDYLDAVCKRNTVYIESTGCIKFTLKNTKLRELTGILRVHS